MLNKQSQTADEGWFENFGVGRGAKNLSPYNKNALCENGYLMCGLEWIVQYEGSVAFNDVDGDEYKSKEARTLHSGSR
jgi:hypothetical protein